MSLEQKIEKMFSYKQSLVISNEPRRFDGEWYVRFIWRHILLPHNRIKTECRWEGFETFEECIDNCLEYLGNT